MTALLWRTLTYAEMEFRGRYGAREPHLGDSCPNIIGYKISVPHYIIHNTIVEHHAPFNEHKVTLTSSESSTQRRPSVSLYDPNEGPSLSWLHPSRLWWSHLSAGQNGRRECSLSLPRLWFFFPSLPPHFNRHFGHCSDAALPFGDDGLSFYAGTKWSGDYPLKIGFKRKWWIFNICNVHFCTIRIGYYMHEQ